MSNDVDISKQQPTVESIMAILDGVAKQIMEVSAELKEIAALQKEAEQRQKAADKRQKAADERQKAADERQKAADERLKATDAQIEATDAQIEATGVYLKKLGAELSEVTDAQIKTTEAQFKETGVYLKKLGAELSEVTDAQIKATDAQLKETGVYLKKLGAELSEVTDAQIKATDAQLKETGAQLKETGVYLKKLGAELGNVGNQWGKIAEYLVGADFRAILKERFDITVDFAARRFDGSYQGEDWEVDVAAANGEVAVVGEVKVTMTVKKIDKFVAKNLSNFHLYVPDHRHKKIYGLIAFVKIDEGYEEAVLARARECGLLIVRAIGDTFKVLNPAGTKLRDYGAAKTS